MKNSTPKVLYIFLFYVIAIALRYYLIVIKPDFYVEAHPHIQSLLSGISPLVAGLFLVKGLNRPNDLKLFSVGIWPSIMAIAIPILLFYLIGIINIGQPYANAPTLIATAIIYGIFEEYGWRGYLQSELSHLNKFYKYLIISILWYIWHLNFGLTMGHFVSYLFVLVGSIGIGFVADKSKSLIFVGLFHAFFNLMYIDSLPKISTLQIMSILGLSAIAVIGIMLYTARKKTSSLVS